ncbi:putative transcription initiation factor IIF subunit beta [Pestalotiopsis sp. NC0098]|nr:putative transcription initiation factor IIF subunit beta [Pestalotiopsis sp. NC0098]
MATVKSEPGVKLEPGIKPDPDDVKPSPGGFEDDELYEDAGDLEFYDATQPHDPQGNAFLAHLPTYLYDQWAQLGEEEELVVGKVRTWTELDKSGQQIQKFAILADPNNPAHQNVPKEYMLEMRDPNLLNTFMFTEQDLPGFKNKSQGGPNNNIPAYLRPKPAQPKPDTKQEPGGRNRRREPYYRKAIPKKTVLAAKFRREVNAQPVMTPEAKHILSMRASDALKPKATTSIMSGTRNPVGIIHAGTAMGNAKMSGFVQTVGPKAKTKAKREEKAARMEQSALLDAIFACYTDTKFDYWSMKAFKNRLKQPEAWLRENLEQVAVLHKTGRFANYWELKPEYQKRKPNADTAAAEVADFDDDDDEDDNVEMEDVV